MGMPAWSANDGQASIELVGIVPLAVLVAFAVGQLLAAGAARELAGNAAEAGAAAILQGGDPKTEARDALPGWSEDRAEVRVDGRVVRVRLRPLAVIPGVADRLVATVVADAGPVR
jgi:pilus assembly protein CpaE